MKKKLFSLMILGALISCKNDDDFKPKTVEYYPSNIDTLENTEPDATVAIYDCYFGCELVMSVKRRELTIDKNILTANSKTFDLNLCPTTGGRVNQQTGKYSYLELKFLRKLPGQ